MSQKQPLRKTLRLPALVIVTSALFALVLWTIPTWTPFWSHVAQFPALWQIESNRRGIIILVVKVLSPFVVALIFAACCWLSAMIRPLLAATHEDNPDKTSHRRPEQSSAWPPPVVKPTLDPIAPTGVPTLTDIDLVSRGRAPGAEYVRIMLLKGVSMEIVAPNGMRAVVPLTLNAKRVQLLAYIAWRRGETVNRDKILEQVFGHGLPDGDATPQRLSDAFDSHRKLLRRNLRETIARLNEAAGTELIPADLDIFHVRQQQWGLASTCRVTDLEAVEAQHQIIEAAHQDGRLINDIPEEVKRACDALLKAYSGDFLENLLRGHIADFDPWPSSWVRKPFTRYRDYYLEALWYSAQYEWGAGQRIGGASAGWRQQEHYGRAAQLYSTYATNSVNNRVDTKLSFGRPGREHGERIIMSERALRRALMLYGIVGEADQVDQVWTEYTKHMKRLSSDQWIPRKETLQDLEHARSQTGAHQRSLHDPLPSPETAERAAQ